MNRRAKKLRRYNGDGAADPCVVCGSPSQWSHHVAGHANAPKVEIRVCRRCADLLDAFLSLAGVKLKHDKLRTDAELAWATVAGIDGLRAARDGKPELSPIALAVGRLLATHSGDVRGPRPAAGDARHKQRCPPVAATARFETARARAMHDLFAAIPAVVAEMPDMLASLRLLATNPGVFNAFERLDAEAVEPLYAAFERAAVELLDVWRGDQAGDPDAQAAVQPVEQRFVRTLHSMAQHIDQALGESAGHSREPSA